MANDKISILDLSDLGGAAYDIDALYLGGTAADQFVTLGVLGTYLQQLSSITFSATGSSGTYSGTLRAPAASGDYYGQTGALCLNVPLDITTTSGGFGVYGGNVLDYTIYKSNQIVYNYVDQATHTLTAYTLSFPLGTGTLATQEWVNAQGFGGGTADGNYYHTPSYTSGLSIATGTGVNAMYVPIAGAGTLGAVKGFHRTSGTATGTKTTSASNAPAISARTTTSGRYYGVETDATGAMFVNVPWTDNNTDTKVTQTAATTSPSAMPLLLAPAGQTATTTTTANFASNIYAVPSTGRLYVTGGTNPWFGLQASGGTRFFLQALSDELYLGPTTSKALKFTGSTGAISMPNNLTVAGTIYGPSLGQLVIDANAGGLKLNGYNEIDLNTDYNSILMNFDGIAVTGDMQIYGALVPDGKVGKRITLATLQANLSNYYTQRRIIQIAMGATRNIHVESFINYSGGVVQMTTSDEISGRGEHNYTTKSMIGSETWSLTITSSQAYIRYSFSDYTLGDTAATVATDVITSLTDDICQFYII